NWCRRTAASASNIIRHSPGGRGSPSGSVPVARTLRAHLVRCEADIRNTYASLLIGQRESFAYVKEQICHHSIRVAVDTYGCLCRAGTRRGRTRSTCRSLQPAATGTQPAPG